MERIMVFMRSSSSFARWKTSSLYLVLSWVILGMHSFEHRELLLRILQSQDVV